MKCNKRENILMFFDCKLAWYEKVNIMLLIWLWWSGFCSMYFTVCYKNEMLKWLKSIITFEVLLLRVSLHMKHFICFSFYGFSIGYSRIVFMTMLKAL